MMQNYKAWDIDPHTLSGSIEDVAYFAVLAPSSHNSQPWKISIANTTITLAIEKTRTIPIGDFEHRFSQISLGCALENILIAADFFGYEYEVTCDVNNNASIKSELKKTNGVGNQNKTLIDSMLARVTNRGAYDSKRLPSGDFIDSYNNTESIKLNWIIEADPIRLIAKICVDASTQAMERASFRKELSEHVRSNLTHKKTGIPGFGLGIPTPPSLLGPFLVRNFNMSKMTYKKDLQVLSGGPVFCIMITQGFS